MTRKVVMLPESWGVCEKAFSKRHVTSAQLDGMVCLLCGERLPHGSIPMEMPKSAWWRRFF